MTTERMTPGQRAYEAFYGGRTGTPWAKLDSSTRACWALAAAGVRKYAPKVTEPKEYVYTAVHGFKKSVEVTRLEVRKTRLGRTRWFNDQGVQCWPTHVGKTPREILKAFIKRHEERAKSYQRHALDCTRMVAKARAKLKGLK
jgi:hypothetical protein